MPKPSQPIIDGHKLCTKCRVMKPVGDFYVRKGRKTVGLFSSCKACCGASQQSYHAKNPGKRAALSLAWQKKNPERANQQRRKSNGRRRESVRRQRQKWRDKNRERLASASRHRSALERMLHPDKPRARLSKWRKANKDKVNVWTRNRRAKMNGNPGKLLPSEWSAIKASQGYRCLMCGLSEPHIRLTIDHVVPVSRGGSNDKSNIQGLCKSCNCSKNAKVIDFRRRAA